MDNAAGDPPCADPSGLQRALDRLNALISWERADRLRMQVDLTPIIDLLARLGNPHRRFRSVHVTGTKGKGSVCALAEAGLGIAGWRVGRYASPHVQHINERINIDRRPIEDERLAEALMAALDVRDAACRDRSAAMHATWFDVMTAATYLSFAQAGLDWAVVEVGLGGRLDSTNAIEADVAVITNIGLEHMDVLGDSIEKIAAEKAGIIKPGCTVVTPMSLRSPAGQVIDALAIALCAPVRSVLVPRGATISQQNLAVARAALNALGGRGIRSIVRNGPLSAADLSEEVASSVKLPGRMERFRLPASLHGGRWIDVVLDGAHVDFALAAVLRELRMQHDLQARPVVLLALGADKNANAFAAALAGEASIVVCTQVQAGRPGMDLSVLADAVRQVGLATQNASDPLQGFKRCCELADAGWILVTGSFYLVSAIREELAALS